MNLNILMILIIFSYLRAKRPSKAIKMLKMIKFSGSVGSDHLDPMTGDSWSLHEPESLTVKRQYGMIDIDMTRQKTTIADSLRRALIENDIPYLALERATGVSRGSISRFVNGERDLYLHSAALLAEELDLELVPKRRRK